MPNLTMSATVVLITVLALTGSLAIQLASIGALLCLGALSVILRNPRKTDEIGFPDHEESSIGTALDEFMAREAAETAKESVSDMSTPVTYVGREVNYLSRRAGTRAATIVSYIGRGIYELEIVNAIGKLARVRRHRDNFQLA